MPAAESQSAAGGKFTTCCTAFYEQPWVWRLAGDVFHPGGADLTQRTVRAMQLAPGARVLDLGCGTGSSTLLLAREFGFAATGLDPGGGNIERARERAREGALDVVFKQGDGAALPFPNRHFDGVLSECVISLFPDRPAVLEEVARVLKPAGALAVTDMAVDAPLPAELAEALAPWTCLSDALTHNGFRTLFEDSGFELLQFADESDGLTSLASALKRQMLVMGAGAMLAETGAPAFDLDRVRHWLKLLSREVERGHIRYLRYQLLKSQA